MSDIATALAFDIVVLCVCCVVLYRYGRLSLLHPAPIYLFFHFYTVTLRLVALTLGAPTMLMPQPLALSEIIRASVTFDAALAGATCVWLYLASKEKSVGTRTSQRIWREAILLSPRVVRIVAWSTVIIGIFGLRYLRFSDSFSLEQNSASLGGWDNSAWVSQIVSWAQQGSLMLAYLSGFNPLLAGLTAVFFGLTMLSTARYVLVLGGLFACFMSLSLKKLRWPTFRYTVLLLFIAALWFPLKVIVASVWEGADAGTIASNAGDYLANASDQGSTADTLFLDMTATTMSLVDDHGEFFYGGTLLPLLVSPVPRLWWPEKPGLNEFTIAISTPVRPINEYGAITTLVGEGYGDFWYAGAVLFPMLAAYIYGRWYFAAMRRPHNSVARFLYLVVASMLIQVYRDGFISSVIFPFVAAMPMLALVAVHWVIRSVEHRSANAAKLMRPPLAVSGGPGF
jgi:hypothetical protein